MRHSRRKQRMREDRGGGRGGKGERENRRCVDDHRDVCEGMERKRVEEGMKRKRDGDG